VVLVGSVLAFVQLAAVRFYPRILYEVSLRKVEQRERTLIVGTGEAGLALARQLWLTPNAEIKPVGFVGEDAELRGSQIEGIPVLGGVEDIEGVAKKKRIEQILIALPEASPEEIENIRRECVKTKAKVKMAPAPTEFLVPMASADLDDTDTHAVLKVFHSGRLALGPNVAEFEQLVADYVGAEHAIAVNSGTSALHLLCRAAGLGPGDEVITTPFSFVASTNCFIYEGGRPVFVDIEPDTYNLDPALIEEAITPATRAILPVDVFGHPANWDAIEEVADRHGLKIIADACESIGAEYRARKTGPFGVGGAFAFYPNKQITTGEGGMIVTNSNDTAALCRSMANQGRGEMGQWLEHARLGFNYRMSELAGALGVSQMHRVDEFVAKRARVAAVYNKLLADEHRVRPPLVRPDVKMSFFVYVVKLQGNFERDEVMERLAEKGVPTRAYFNPIHTQPYISEAFGYSEGMFPVTERVARKTIALPFHNTLSEVEAEYVVAALSRTLDELSLVGALQGSQRDGESY
jgi:perosamine synthetase